MNSDTGSLKRKAVDDAAPQSIQAPRRIKALDQVVINKIAAGEIIVAPVHALKELIENAVDAGSTSLEIVVKDGGLKLLQITDNGHGINLEDMPILCERFTTSKLKSFEDLNAIGTYGFRGEALASISHIAHLTITTKTSDSSCAYRAVYSDGKLVPPKPGQSADPKPVAGRQGTQITVEDLFYNTPSRRRAFRSPGEEYSKILDVVGRYAVHCSGVAFSCKKFGDADSGICTTATASVIDRIRRIHGSSVANELLEFTTSSKHLGFEATGMISNANYHVKKTTLLLFINHRSVESSAIKKGLENVYATYLPKGGHPFIYLSLEIEPHRVDVNIHPTKREVNFLYEDEIVAKIVETVEEKLAAVDTSRSYTLTQTLLPGTKPIQSSSSDDTAREIKANDTKARRKKEYEYNMVRTDNRDRKITTMFENPPTNKSAGDSVEYETNHDSTWTLINYTTIHSLRASVRDSAHTELSVQHGLRLYLVDYAAVSYELFYQIGLSDFANFGRIVLDPPMGVRDILEIAVEEEKAKGEEGDFDWESAINTIEQLLLSKRPMLKDYLSLEISEDGSLVSIPLLLKGYMPSLGKLPSFILRLGPNIDWTSELECFDTLLRELALFYVPEKLPSVSADADDGNDVVAAAGNWDVEARRKELGRMVETAIFPVVRKRLIAPKTLLGAVTEVANLKGLYRIFERSC
ncbi:uncharacterized protein LAJ45_00411 [Morchella importuna]|uniref:uncharacterized protein n=1 Tax=Morchella importuna TaxID=1174673 RepID=UPI001E8DD615|nr:uncharacterized protein LAJ45_00411 [Morchella importuna]KAH8155401.1 hypothetical protein LAJ45_00411 [Morchella importuna]